MLQDEERYVYHYTTAATLAEHILSSGKLRFSRFQSVNDPKEAKDWTFNFYNTYGEKIEYMDEVQDAFNIHLKHDWYVGCLVSDVYEGVVNKAREDKGEDIIGALYERGHSRPSMWVHYGDNHAGACLVFEKASLDKAVRDAAGEGRIIYSGRVEYRNPPVVPKFGITKNEILIDLVTVKKIGVEAAARQHMEAHFGELLFAKNPDWAPEREFRWVISVDEDEYFYVNIYDSLVGIALGDQFPRVHSMAVGVYSLEHGVSVATMDWQNGVPQPKPSHPRLLM